MISTRQESSTSGDSSPSSSSKVETALSVNAMELVTAANKTSSEEKNTDSCTKAHAVKHFWDRDKHQGRTGLQCMRSRHRKKRTQQE